MGTYDISLDQSGHVDEPRFPKMFATLELNPGNDWVTDTLVLMEALGKLGHVDTIKFWNFGRFKENSRKTVNKVTKGERRFGICKNKEYCALINTNVYSARVSPSRCLGLILGWPKILEKESHMADLHGQKNPTVHHMS